MFELYKPINEEKAIELLNWLKEAGTIDPDIDMWLGTLESDTGLLERAFAQGADTSVSLSSLIDRYRDELQEVGYVLTQ